MEMGLLEWIAGVGGIGAVFGLIMFFVLLKIVGIMREDRKFMEDRLTKLLEKDQESRSENTVALTQLTTYLKMKNGS